MYCKFDPINKQVTLENIPGKEVIITCDDLVKIRFTEPTGCMNVGYDIIARVDAMTNCALHIHNDSDYCGWVEYVWITDIEVISGICPMPLETPDMVNHPKHYKSETGLETIDVIEAFTFDLKGIEATDTGNILKYMCRWGCKNGLEDLKKARWYLNHLIDHVEKLEKENEK